MAKWWTNFKQAHEGLGDLPEVRRDRYSIHLKRPDGQIQAYIGTVPLFYLDEEQVWQELDLEDVRDDGAFWWCPGVDVKIAKGNKKVQFPTGPYSQTTSRIGRFDPATETFTHLWAIPSGTLQEDGSIQSSGPGYSHRLAFTATGLSETFTINSYPGTMGGQPGEYVVIETVLEGIQLEDGWVTQDIEVQGSRVISPILWDASGLVQDCSRYALNIDGVQYLYTGTLISSLASFSYPLVVDPSIDVARDAYVYGQNSSYSTARSTCYGHDITGSEVLVGQRHTGSYYNVYRGLLVFYTWYIGSGATVTQAYLNLYINSKSITSNNFDLQVVDYDWSAYDPPDSGNRETIYDGVLAASAEQTFANTSALTAGQWAAGPDFSGGFLNTDDYTYFALRSSRDYSNTAPSSSTNEYIGLGTQNNNYPATLTVVYTNASGTGKWARLVTQSSSAPYDDHEWSNLEDGRVFNGTYATCADPTTSTGATAPDYAYSVFATPANEPWQNSSNILADDNNYASITTSGFDTNDYSYLSVARFVSFSIPAGADVVGIRVKVKRYCGAGSAVDVTAQIRDYTYGQIGSNLSGGASWPGTETEATFGGATSMWGLTSSQILALIATNNLCFSLRAQATSDDTDLYIDYVSMEIFYQTTGDLDNNEYSYIYRWYDFDFAFPGTVKIDGVRAFIYRKTDSGDTIKDALVALSSSGAPLGDNKADTSTAWPTTETAAYYGSSSDTWGWPAGTLIQSNVESTNFSLLLAVKSEADNSRAYVAYGGLQVWYTPVDECEADSVSSGTPTVGSPTIGQIHALTADATTSGTPTVGSPTIGQIHVLSADATTAGTPTVGSPTLGQTHALSADATTSGIPSVGSPTLGQEHELTATGIASGTPIVGSPTLGQEHALDATGVSSGAPTVGSPTIGQSHTLAADATTSGTPTVGAPDIGSIHNLSADATTSGTPTVGSPTATLVVDVRVSWVVFDPDGTPEGFDELDADPTYSGTPTVGSPTVGQIHALSADATTSGAPTVGSPTLGQIHALSADPATAGTPTVGTPTLGQEHALSADPTTSGTPTVDTPTLEHIHDLAADPTTSGTPTVGTPTLTQEHALTATGVTSGTPTVGTPTAAHIHDLTATSVSSGIPTVGTPTLEHIHDLAADQTTAGTPTVGSPALGQVHILSADQTTSGTPTVGSPTISQGHVLWATSTWAGIPTVGSPTLGQEHALSADPTTSGTPTVGAPTLGVADVDLFADPVYSGTPTVGSPTIGQVHVLSADPTTAGTPTVGSPTLGQVHVLSADPTLSGTPTVGSPTLGQVHVLSADPTTSGTPTVGSPTLGQIHVLSADPTTAGTPTVGSPTLAQANALSADPTTSGTPTVGSPTIGQVHVLSADPTTAGTPTVGSPTLGQTHVLSADPTTSGTPTVGSPTLGLAYAFSADPTTSGTPTVGSPTLGTVHVLSADPTLSGTPTVGSPTLGQTHVLSADPTLSGAPTVGSPTLGQEHQLSADSTTSGTPTVGAPVLSLVLAELEAIPAISGAPVVGSPALGVAYHLSADGIVSGVPIVGSPDIISLVEVRDEVFVEVALRQSLTFRLAARSEIAMDLVRFPE